jgi:hypothetical protein
MRISESLIQDRILCTLNTYKGKNGFFVDFEGTIIETALTTSKQAIELFKELKRELLSLLEGLEDVENIHFEFLGTELSITTEYENNSFDYYTIIIEDL